MRWALLLGLAACPKPQTPDTPSLVQQLSSRDGAPACDALTGEALEHDLADAAEHAVSSVVAMRAADCLVQRFPEAQLDRLRRWVTDPNTAGLARVVFQHLDAMPPAIASALSDAAAAGPHTALLAQEHPATP